MATSYDLFLFDFAFGQQKSFNWVEDSVAPSSVLGVVQLSLALVAILVCLVQLLFRSSRRLAVGWSLLRIISMMVQLFLFIGLILKIKLHLEYPSIKSQCQILLAKDTLTCVAAALHGLTTGLGYQSSYRGIYHLASCFAWSRKYSDSLPSIDLRPDVCVLFFAVSFLLDLFTLTFPASAETARPIKTSLFESLSYSWINPLLGLHSLMTMDSLPGYDLGEDFSGYHNKFVLICSGIDKSVGPFWGFIMREHRRKVVQGSILRLIDEATKLAMPWIIRDLMVNPSMRTIPLLFCVRMIGTLCGKYSLFLSIEIGVYYKSMLSYAIHDKALQSQNQSDFDLSTLGEVDTQRLLQGVSLMFDIWACPLQVLLCLYGLFFLLSWQASVAVVIVICITLPLLSTVTHRMGYWVRKNMEAKDKRTSLTAEILHAIRGIRLHAWELPVISLLNTKRTLEVEMIGRQSVLSATLVSLTQALPPLLTSVAFGALFWSGSFLSSELVFTCITLFTMLNGSLLMLATLVTDVQVMQSSLNRVRQFLGTEPPCNGFEPKTNLSLKPGTGIEADNVNLQGLSDSMLITNGKVCIREGKLAVFAGATGSGKSTLLTALVIRLATKARVAYAPQKPFLIRGTIRDNITFGRGYESERYQQVIQASALEVDFSQLADGDMTSINGAETISGGQKSRVCLARALYTATDIYVLDDPLAALDVKVQAVIVDGLFGKDGLLRNKTTIISTNANILLAKADTVHLLKNGEIIMSEIGQLIDTGNSDVVLSTIEPFTGAVGEELTDHVGEPVSEEAQNGQEVRNSETETSLENFSDASHSIRKYFSYSSAAGWVSSIGILLFSRLLAVGSVYMLKLVSTETRPFRLFRDLSAFTLLSFGQAICTFLFVVFLFKACIIPTTRKIHSALAGSILTRDMGFFEKTPVADTLNLFTNDLARIDVNLSGSIMSLFAQYINLAVTSAVLVLSAPASLLFLAPSAILCYRLQDAYLGALRQLRTLDVDSRAPIINMLQEAQHGQILFSVFGYTASRLREFECHLNRNLRALFPLRCIEVWLGVRVETCSVSIQALTAMILLVIGTKSSTLGFVMTFVLQLTGILPIIARFSAQFEADSVSFYRLQEQINKNLVAESTGKLMNKVPDHSPVLVAPNVTDPTQRWLCVGKIEFREYSGRYRPTLPPCLQLLTFTLTPGEKIAVVGRTGAGKSSLLLALLGLLEQTHGQILVDGVDISSLDGSSLRQSFTIIPQSVVVLSGSVRQNIDVLGWYSDKSIMDALRESNAEAMLQRVLANGRLGETPNDILDAQMTPRSLSVGELQILALARAMLYRSNVLLIDESTAGLDPVSEQQVHETTMRCFPDTTTIAIMHRLELTLDYDRVLVLDQGQIVALDTPTTLVARNDEHYSSMLADAGLLDYAKAMLRIGDSKITE